MEHLNLVYGRDRMVIIEKDKNRVIKIARNKNGLIQNFNEFIFNKKRPDITAKIIEYLGEILVMEYVEPLPNIREDSSFIDKDNPTKEEQERNRMWWIVNLELEKELGEVFDNDQIGITKDGRIVAYDYGHTRDFVFSTIEDGYTQKQKFINYELPEFIDKSKLTIKNIEMSGHNYVLGDDRTPEVELEFKKEKDSIEKE